MSFAGQMFRNAPLADIRASMSALGSKAGERSSMSRVPVYAPLAPCIRSMKFRAASRSASLQMRHPDPGPTPACEAMPKGRTAHHGPWLDRGRLACAQCQRSVLPAEPMLDLKCQSNGGFDHRDLSVSLLQEQRAGSVASKIASLLGAGITRKPVSFPFDFGLRNFGAPGHP